MKTVRLAFAFLIVYFSSIVYTLAQEQGSSPYLIAMEIATANVYEMTPAVGFANQPSQQYKNHQKLVQTADAAALIDIINMHANPVVRLYAYQALHTQKASIPLEIIQKMKNDKAKVVAQQGCVVFDASVASLAEKPLEINNSLRQVQTPNFF